VESLCGKEFVEKAKAAFTLVVEPSTMPIRKLYLDHLKGGLPQLIDALPLIRQKCMKKDPHKTNVLDALDMM